MAYSAMRYRPRLVRGRRRQHAVTTASGQPHDESVSVELVAGPDFDDAERARLMSALLQKVQGQVQFDFRFVGDILQHDGGKFQFVVSRLN